MQSLLLTSNEALAQAVWEAGTKVCAAYPGSPSTEVLENLALHDDLYCEWSANEKIALELVAGASMGGVRAFAAMKNVGLNVAADPFMSLSSTGVGGGLVILVADDPGCHSSQGEQDSRYFAAMAKVLCLEPSSAQEAYDMGKMAFELSERFDTPVMIRYTTAVAHSRQLVQVEDVRRVPELGEYQSRPDKFVLLPAHARERIKQAHWREDDLLDWAATSPLNKVEQKDTQIGIICSGVHYHYLAELMPEASLLKLGVSWPLSFDQIADFVDSVDKFYVIDEANTYLYQQVCAMGLDPEPLDLPRSGELLPQHLRQAFGLGGPNHTEAARDLPRRPPTLCMGCPHRLAIVELRRMKAIVTGDIGCYTIGAALPFKAVDSVLEMGASISMARGLELAGVPERTGQAVVAVIGDSTFAHSGISALVNAVYNGATSTIVVLDNQTTAMTGTQPNPLSGGALSGQGQQVQLEALVAALGVRDVVTIDAQDGLKIREELHRAVASPELSVVIVRSPCRLIKGEANKPKSAMPIIQDCRRCGVCVRIGCASLTRDETGHATIDPDSCVGCNQCAQVCPYDRIHIQ